VRANIEIINMKNKNTLGNEEAVLSGYVRYRPINGTYYLMINSRRLSTVLSKKRMNVKVTRQGNSFIVRKNNEGNILTLRTKELVTCISGSILLNDKEREKLKDNNTKFSFPIKVIILPQDFDLDKYSLYPDENAAKLARSLSLEGIKTPQRIMTPKAFPHDLEFIQDNKKVIIEITQARPSEDNYTYNFRHQAQGSSIRAHIFDIYRKCVNSTLAKENNLFGFVILHPEWKNHNHVFQLINEFKQVNCHIMFTNFDKEWQKRCSKDIINTIQNEPTNSTK
jgi:hypothetical protein